MAHSYQTHVGGAELKVEGIREPSSLMPQSTIIEKSPLLTLELHGTRHSKRAPSRPFIQKQLSQQDTTRECDMATECERDRMTTARNNDETHSCTPSPLPPICDTEGRTSCHSAPPRSRDGELKRAPCVLCL
jgi:hypothetical protein